MRRLLLIAMMAGVIMSLGAQDQCADDRINIPTLPGNPETIGVPTILEFTTRGSTTTSPSWSIASGSASITAGASSSAVTVSANGDFELQLDWSGGNTCTLNRASNVAINPDFIIECGLDAILVLDESNSIDATEEEGVRTAVRAFLTALDGTGSRVSIVEFGSYATAEVFTCNVGVSSPNWVEITTANRTGCLETYLSGDYGTVSTGGGTNWDDALVKVQDVLSNNVQQPDIIIFFTDGNPTYYINSFGVLDGSGAVPYVNAVTHAIEQANIVKQSTHVFVIGVGDNINEENIKMISGIRERDGSLVDDDYVISPDFNTLAQDFKDVALEACGTTVAITKTGPGCVEPNTPSIQYTINYSNDGAFPGRNVKIHDLLPAGYTFLSSVRNPNVGTISNVGNNYTWSFDNTLIPVGGSGSWTITVQPPQTSGVATNVAIIKGSNIITDADDTSRVVTTINSISISETHEDITCNDENGTTDDGSIDISVSGGVSPYTYSWSNGATTQDLSSLTAGTYIVTVTDDNDCSRSLSVTIDQAAAFSLTETHEDETCAAGQGSNNDGSVQLTPVNGTAPFNFSLNQAQNQTGSFTGLAPGSYTASVVDSDGCSASVSFVIDAGTVISCSAQQVNTVSFWGEADGSATASGSGGSGDYAYLWDNGETTATATQLTAGPHTVTVTDNVSGCFTTCSVTIDNPTNLPPVADPDYVTTDEDTPISINVIGNDTDDFGLDTSTITVAVQDQPSNGGIVINGDGTITYSPDEDFVGVDSFIYEICDIGVPVYCDTALVVITVQPIPDTVYVTIPEDSTFTVCTDTTTNFATPITSVGICGNGDHGDIVTTTGTCVQYTPDSHYVGNDTACVVTCSGALCDTTIIIITITPVNEPPVAFNDINNTLIGVPVGGQVLTNDSDPDDDNIIVTLVNGVPVVPGGTTVPTPNGSVTINPDGTYIYTPDPGFDGTETFTYQICDDGVPGPLCDDAVVTIEIIKPTDPVNNPPVANNDAAQTEENTAVIINVIANDYDPDGDPLSTPVQTSSPSNGTVTQNPDGSFTYTPDPGFTGEDAFNYEICDPSGLCDQATVTILVTPDNGPGNDPPIAMDDVFYTPSETPLLADVSLNDYDPDGDPVTFSQITSPAHGSVVFNPDGTFTYTPDPAYAGPDQFIYEICDGISGCDLATVYIVVGPVNDPPVAINDINNTLVNIPVAGQVLTNDYDPNQDIITLTEVNGVPVVVSGTTVPTGNGTVTIFPDGNYAYTPNPGFVGTDTYTYEICDNGVPGPLCNTAVVSIEVLDPGDPINNPPVANDDATQTEENTAVTINVIANDYDPDGDVLTTPTQISSPSNGSVTQNPDGTFTYTPNTGFTGVDQFNYEICDPAGLCDQATVTIVVHPDNGEDNDPPVAVDDVFYTPYETGFSADVSLNDYDPDGDSQTFVQLTSPSHGTVTFNPDGTFTYTPDAGYTGPDQFTYENCDGISGCDNATVYIVVGPVNDPPVAIDDVNNTLIDIPVSGQVLTNDYDPNNDIITLTEVNGVPVLLTGTTVPTTNGSVTIFPDGNYTYTPNTGFTGEDSYTYEICDNGVPGPLCTTATVTIEVLDPRDPFNNPPVANDDATQTEENTPVVINVIANDYDPDGDALSTPNQTSNPSNGTVTQNPDGSFTYTPDQGFTGEDQFTYEICDPAGLCDEATVTIVVTPDNGNDNDPPVAVDDVFYTDFNIPFSADASLNDYDPDGDTPLTFTQTSSPAHGTVTFNPDGTFTYTPDNDYSGPDQFTYEVCDGISGCDQATVYIVVGPENLPPVAEDDVAVTDEDTPVIINVVENDYDPEGGLDTLSIAILDSTDHGTLVINGDGTVTYTPDQDYVGQDTFTYIICDVGDPVRCDSAQVVITVVPVNDLFCTIVQDSEVSCNGGSNAQATVTVFDGDGNYTYLWDNGETGATATGLDVGPHSVTATDGDGFSTTCSVTITEPAALSLSETHVDVICLPGGADATGSIDLTVSGGIPPYTYVWSNGATTQDVSGITPGTYTVDVFDARLCTDALTIVVADNTQEPGASATGGRLTCAVTSIQLSGSSATAGVSYSWSGPGGFTSAQQNPVVTVPGTYVLTVTNTATNCNSTADAVVTQDITTPNVTATGGALTCTATSVQIFSNSTTPGVTYAWTGPQGFTSNVDDPFVSVEGQYTVTVTNTDNGCTASATVTVRTDQTRPGATATGGAISCNDPSVQLTGSSGFQNVSYSWTGPGGFTSNQQNPVVTVPGNYTLTVTENFNGCISTATAVVSNNAEPTPLTITSTNVRCNGAATGSATVSWNTIVAPYTILWSNGATTATVNGLTAGTYTVTVTNANGCASTKSVTITEPDELAATLQAADPSCFGEADGSITVSVIGGTAPYTYQWSNNGSTGPSQGGLAAGTYTITVRDANGCTVQVAAIIFNPPAIGISSVNTAVSCNGASDGAIDLTVIGGTAPYDYQWTNGATTEDLSGIGAGTYVVLVTDANGCTKTISVSIGQPTTLQAGASGSNASCNGASDGSVNLTVSGGTAPYSYQWSNGATSEDISDLAPGTYTVGVTDANGCEATASATIAEPATLNVTATGSNATCSAGGDGSINATVSGGTAPYSYSWSNGATTEDLSGLTPGTYVLVVTDANGCIGRASVTITSPGNLTVRGVVSSEISCNGAGDGSIDLTVSGGTTPYTYSWSNGATTEDLSGLGAGTYTVTVSDANQCSGSATVTLSEPDELEASIGAISDYDCGNVSCAGASDGSVDIDVDGGTGAYTYVWSNGSTDQDLTGVPAGTYSVTVTDENGCTATASVTLTEPEAIDIILDSLSVFGNGGNTSCIGETDGFIDINVVGGCPPYLYSWSTGDVTEDLVNIGEGTYTITVVDANGCSNSATYELDDPDLAPLFVEAQGPGSGCAGEPVTLTTAPGNTDYQWFQDGQPIQGANGNTITVTESGVYVVAVENSDLCAAGVSNPVPVTINEVPLVELSSAGDQGICAGESFTLEATDGYASYTWYQDGVIVAGANGSTYTTGTAGVYTVSASDANGCGSNSNDTLTLIVNPNPEPEIEVPTVLVCPGGGTVEISTDDGYTIYQWYFNGDTISGANGPILEIGEDGVYSVEVSNGSGCSGSTELDIDLIFPEVQTDTVYTDIVQLEGEVLCLQDEFDFIGNQITSLTICREPEFVTFDYTIIGTELCLEFSRNDEEAHIDTLCIIVCDNSACGLCDTTIIILNLPDIDEPPVATEECVVIEENESISVDVLENDIDPDGDEIVLTGIIGGPLHGTAIIEGNGTSILYTPDADYCGEDTVYYEVCDVDGAGCDTAFICIEILCDCFIPNVLTPNGDGLNDFFEVECLEQIDGAVLRVYNRWGNEVFNDTNYKNDWNGTYKGKPLPEGTYFFLIEFTDHDGNEINKAGDLTILR